MNFMDFGGEVVVDLCCGTGKLTLHISKYSASRTFIIRLDFSKAMLNRAMSKKTIEKWKRNY